MFSSMEASPSPMQQAISNPLILSKIFQNSRSDQIKRQRLVCRTWDEIILSLPVPRLGLVVNRSMLINSRSKAYFPTFAATMNPKLARWISISERQSPVYRINSHGLRNLRHCGENIGKHVEFISVTINVSGVLVLHDILKDHFPNLKSFSFRMRGCPVEGCTNLMSPLSIKPKLKEIHFQCGIASPSNELHTMVQLVVNAAPNLKKLNLSINSFPDLSNNMTLESFIYCGIMTEDQSPNLTPLSELLNRVSSTLKHLNLRLHKRCWDVQSREDIGFVMPKMPKLLSFRSNCIQMFPCGYAMQDVIRGNLRSLSFSKGRGRGGDIQELLENISTFNGFLKSPLVSLTSLCIEGYDGITDASVLAKLKKPFPCLKRLQVSLKNCLLPMTMDRSDPEYEWQLEHVLNACSAMDELRHVGIKIRNPPTILDILHFFGNHLDLFQKLKVLDISGVKWSSINNDFGFDLISGLPWEDNMSLAEDVIASIKGMDIRVNISDILCPQATANRLLQYIVDNSLPVTLELIVF